MTSKQHALHLVNPIEIAPATAAAPMRALVQTAYGSADVFRIDTIAQPTPAAGEVIVKVATAGLDRGTWHLMTGRPYLMRLMGYGFRAPKDPIAGRDLAGTVVAVGEGVTRFRVGDEVFGVGKGSFAELARASEDKLTHKPRSVSFEQAGVLAVSGGAALQACDAAKIQRGERVLVIGASGGVGTFAVQVAKSLGAEVTGVASGGKLEVVRSAGADRVLDYAMQDFTAETYDVILDVGGNTPLRRLRRALTPRGRLVFVGGEHGGDWTAGFGRQLLAFAISPFVRQRFTMLTAKEHASYFERLARMAESGQLTAMIDRRIPLHAIPTAMRDLEAGKVRGKVVVQIA